MLKIGIAMIAFTVIFSTLAVIYYAVDAMLVAAFDEITATVLSDLLYFFIYCTAFAVPAVLLILLCKNDGTPIIKKVALPKETPLYIIGGISLILSFAYINAQIMGVFNYGDFSSDVLWQADYDAPYKIVLQLLITAVAPGIFEELLFRGVILAKLRPYGKMPAILISAVLFGLMHQNAEQFLYAMAAGVVLGFVATETNSLLCCILIHFTNNAYSVISQAALANMPEEIFAALSFIAELLIFLGGIASVIALAFVYHKRRRQNDFSGGIFKKELILSSPLELPAPRAARLFFSPTIIVFLAIAGVSAASLICESLLYSVTV